MADDYMYLSISAQKGFLEKCNTLREEIRGIMPMANDPDLGTRIKINIVASLEDLERAENMLIRSVHYTEINHALGFTIL